VKLLTLKLAFLIAITSPKRIRDLHVLSVTSSCPDFASGLVKVILHPRPYYIPKMPFFTISLCCSSALLFSHHLKLIRKRGVISSGVISQASGINLINFLSALEGTTEVELLPNRRYLWVLNTVSLA